MNINWPYVFGLTLEWGRRWFDLGHVPYIYKGILDIFKIESISMTMVNILKFLL
jgi:hypothetical protein